MKVGGINMLTNWAEKLDEDVIAYNEVKEDGFLSCLILNKKRRQAFMIAGVIRKPNPTPDDIEYFFETSDELFKALSEWNIPCSRLLLV